eukprot:585530-Amphidinium_carterae.1
MLLHTTGKVSDVRSAIERHLETEVNQAYIAGTQLSHEIKVQRTKCKFICLDNRLKSVQARGTQGEDHWKVFPTRWQTGVTRPKKVLGNLQGTEETGLEQKLRPLSSVLPN